MQFRVFKCSIDGICGGDEVMDLKKVLSEVMYSQGWKNKDEMHKAIKRWAKTATSGKCFKTHGSAIVAVAPINSLEDIDQCPKCGNDDLAYDGLDPVANGNVEQIVSCPSCGERWQDIFVLAERRRLAKVKSHA